MGDNRLLTKSCLWVSGYDYVVITAQAAIRNAAGFIQLIKWL